MINSAYKPFFFNNKNIVLYLYSKNQLDKTF